MDGDTFEANDHTSYFVWETLAETPTPYKNRSSEVDTITRMDGFVESLDLKHPVPRVWDLCPRGLDSSECCGPIHIA